MYLEEVVQTASKKLDSFGEVRNELVGLEEHFGSTVYRRKNFSRPEETAESPAELDQDVFRNRYERTIDTYLRSRVAEDSVLEIADIGIFPEEDEIVIRWEDHRDENGFRNIDKTMARLKDGYSFLEGYKISQWIEVKFTRNDPGYPEALQELGIVSERKSQNNAVVEPGPLEGPKGGRITLNPPLYEHGKNPRAWIKGPEEDLVTLVKRAEE